MFKLFVLNVAWLVRGLWKLVKTLIDEFTASKINIYGGNDFKDDILKIIDEQCLEARYAGKLPNKTSNFFPPELI